MAKKVGAINTETMLLIGGGLVLAYMLTKKTAVTTPTTIVTVPSGGGSGISSGQLVTIGNSLINALDDIFG